MNNKSLIVLALASLLFPLAARAGGAGAPSCIPGIYDATCSENPPKVRSAKIDAVLPRACGDLSVYRVTQGYSATADDVRVSAQEEPAWQFPTNFQSPSNGISDYGIATIYRDNVAMPRNENNQVGGFYTYGPGYNFYYTSPGTHTWRVDTYINVAPAGSPFPLGQPHVFRGPDVIATTPEADSCGGQSGGGSGGGTPPAEVCGDGIDNNGNGQIDENCQPQTITMNQAQLSCSGTSPQVGLSWSSTVVRNTHELAALGNTGFAEAFRKSGITNQIAIGSGTPPVGGGTGTSTNGPISYTVMRDGQAIAVTTQTSYTDVTPQAGSHAYQVFATSSSLAFIQSTPQNVTTGTCSSTPAGGNPPPSSPAPGNPTPSSAAGQLLIQYDGRITKSPPPGFRQSYVPSVNETAP